MLGRNFFNVCFSNFFFRFYEMDKVTLFFFLSLLFLFYNFGAWVSDSNNITNSKGIKDVPQFFSLFLYHFINMLRICSLWSLFLPFFLISWSFFLYCWFFPLFAFIPLSFSFETVTSLSVINYFLVQQLSVEESAVRYDKVKKNVFTFFYTKNRENIVLYCLEVLTHLLVLDLSMSKKRNFGLMDDSSKMYSSTAMNFTT